MKKLLMEFLGTFFLVLSIAMGANAIAIASMLMAWLYIGGYISGGHYNPMVSLAVALRGRLKWAEFLPYICAQILGGIAAFGMTSFLQGEIVIPAPGNDVMLRQAMLVEILLAFVLAFVVLVTTTADKFRTSHIFGLAIGFTVPALAVVGGPISGGLFNPAIAFGASIVGFIQGSPIVWEHLCMYVGGAFAGGALAAYAFKHFYDKD
jgi:aquaporin Z